MQHITVKNGQELVDIAMQYSGHAGALVALALENELSVTDVLQNGQVLRAVAVQNRYVVRQFETEGVIPASAAPILPDGIGYWGVAVNFIIS